MSTEKLTQALELIAEARQEGVALAKDVALAELEAYRAHFGFDEKDINEETHGALVRAIVAGRVSFEPSEEVFTYTLRNPIDNNTGPAVESLTIRQPNTLDLSKANKGKPEEMEMTQRLVSYVSGQPLFVAQRIRQGDITVIGSLFAFFG